MIEISSQAVYIALYVIWHIRRKGNEKGLSVCEVRTANCAFWLLTAPDAGSAHTQLHSYICRGGCGAQMLTHIKHKRKFC